MYKSNETNEEADNHEHYTSFDQAANYSNPYQNHNNHSAPEEYSNGNRYNSQPNRLNPNPNPLPTSGKQRSGTQLYQSHKLSLRPVNRPSLEKTRANTVYTQSSNNVKFSPTNIHSPIKTSNEYSDHNNHSLNVDEKKSTGRQPRTSGHQLESRLYQQTASSTNRTSRTSDLSRSTSNVSDNAGGAPRARSPRR